MQRSLTKSIVTLFAVAIVTLVALLFAVFLPADSTPAYAAEPVEGTTTTEQVSDASGVMDADALKAAVENGGEVVLGSDITADVVIPEGKTVTIDLNGHTLTNNSDHTIINYGTLTVEDSSTGETGKVDNVTHGKAAIYNEVGATFTLASGTLDRTKEAGTSSSSSGDNSYYTLLNHGTAYINGGTIQQGGLEVGKYSSLVENGWYDGSKNTEKKPSIMTVNGGTFLGGLNSIKNDDYGELNIIYATVKNVAQAALLNWNVATIKGGSFSTDGGSAVILNGYINDTMDKGELTITGGEFTTNGGDFPLIARMDGSKPTGGVITVTVTSTNADLVAAAINVPGVTTYVKEGDAVTEMSVSDLAGLKEALNTETVKKITLACDITSDESLFFERDVTLDMNGYELTVAKTTTYEQNGKTYTYHPVVIDKANVTIVNGNITVGKGVYANLNAILVTNRATLTLGTKSDETVVEDDRVFVTTNSGYGIVVSGGAALNMYGGSVTAKWSALGTNNTTGTAAFNVYGATLESTDDSAIFMSCYTDVYLKDTAVIGKTAIDIRIGNLTVDGGSITSTYDGYHEMTYDEVTASGTLTGGDGSAILVKANYYYDKANNSNEVSIKISETTEIKGAVTIYDLDGVGNMLPNDKVVDQTEALQTFVDSLKNSHASVETHFYDVALPAGGSEDGTIVNVDKVFVADNESVTATVSSLDELRAAFAEKKIGKIVIGADFEISGNRIEIGDINDPNAATRSITLDLNGHTLKIGTIRVSDTDSSANTAALYLGYNVSLTLTDTVGTGTIDASGANDLTVPIGAMRDGSTLTVERGTIIVDTDRESCVFAMGGGKIVIKGGTFINNCTSDYAYGGGRPLTVNIENNSTSTIDITEGTFKGRNPMSGDDNTDVAFVSKDSKVVEYKDGNMTVVGKDTEVTGEDIVAVYTYADNEAGDTVATVYTEDALRAALAEDNYDTVKLGADIQYISKVFVIDRPVTLDLADNILSTTSGYVLEITSSNVTVTGSVLSGEHTNTNTQIRGTIGIHINGTGVADGIKDIRIENIRIYTTSTVKSSCSVNIESADYVTLDNVTIRSSADCVRAWKGSENVTVTNSDLTTDGENDPNAIELLSNSSMTVTDSKITANGYGGAGIFIGTDDGGSSDNVAARLKVDGTTIISADAFGITGNGTQHGTYIEITDNAVITCTNFAVYHPQKGELKISGNAKITGASGIEMRAGTLIVTGTPTVTATDETYDESPLNDGPRFAGVALGVSRYFAGSENGVTLDIRGGTFKAKDGGYAFCEKDIAVTDAEDNRDLSFDGATFEGRLSSQNETGFIKSGTFSEGVDLAYVADGQKVGIKSDGGMEVADEISGEGYDAIYSVSSDDSAPTTATVYTADALNDAVNAGVNVVLGGDIKANVVIPEGKTVTLDLNGYTLTNDGDHTIINYGTLTVEDSSTGEPGKVDNVTHGKAAIYNEVGATFTLASGTLDRTKEAGTSSSSSGDNSYYTLLNHGTAYINGGTIQQGGGSEVGKYSSLVENGWYDGSKNTEKKPSIMIVNGGTFLGGLNSIKNDDYGELTIKDATVKNVAQAALLNWNVATIKGGSFSTDGGSAVILNGYINDTMDKGELTITGGTFTTNGGDFPLIARMDGSEPTGGVITVTSTDADLVAAAINVPGVTTYVKEGDAVTEMSVSDLVGLKEALNTETVEKITIGADFEISGNRIEIGDINDPNAATRSITLDLNGHTLKIGTIRVSDADSSANTAALYLGYNVSLTLTDTVGSGTIDASGANDLTVPIGAMRSSSTLTVKSGTIIVDTDRESCVFARGGGKIVIIGGTFINNCTSEYAYGGGRPLTVNIENNSTSTIDITGGTFKGRNPMSGDDNTDVAFVSKDSKVVEYKSGNMEVVDQNSEVTGDDVVAVYTYADNETGDTVATVYTEDALRAALADKNYDTVVLGADIGNASETFVIDRPVTLDLNGYTLENKNTTSGNYLLIEGGNSEAENIKVTIRNGNISSGDAAVIVMGYADVVMKNVSVKTDGRYGLELYGECDQSVTAEDCTFEGDTSGVAVFGAEKTGMTASFSATGCTIKGGDYGVSGNGTYHLTTIDIVDSKVSSDRGTAIYHPQVGTLTISGGSEISGISGIEMRAGTLKISGNVSVVATAEEFSVSDLNDGPRFSGVALGVSRYFEGSDRGVTLDISGGTFVAQDKGYAFYEKDIAVAGAEDNTSLSFAGATFNGDLYSENETGFIKSGTFSEVVDKGYIAEGSDLYVTEAGTLEVAPEGSAPAVSSKVVATIGSKGYGSVSDAVSNAKENDTIKLYGDVTENVTINKSVTLDLNGYTLENKNTTSGNYLLIEGGNSEAENIKVTIRNGNISSGDAAVIVMGYADVVMENVSVKTDGRYGLELYGECDQSVTAEGCTFEGDTSGVVVFGAEKIGMTAAFSATGCTIKGGDYGVSGNGTYHLTTIDIVDSKVSSDRGTAIYHPQVGTLTISGGSEISGISGIEMRAGTLKISGNVSVIATAEEFSVSDLNDGPRFGGVALGVSRYFEDSDRGVTLDISGGTFVAQDKGYAFYEKDIAVAEAEDNTSLSFAGATFNGDLYSENETGFIKSGTFSKGVDLAYVADGQKVGVKPGGGMEVGSEISGEGFDAIYTVSGDENASMSAIVYTADKFKDALDNESVTEITLGKDFGGSYTIDRDVTIKAADGVTFSGNIVIESSSVTRTTGPNVKLEGVAFKGNGSGTAISVKNGSLTMTGGSITDYDNGIVAGTRGGAAVDISVDNVTFTELDEKGIYGEAFGKFTVSGSTFNGAGNDASGAGNPYTGRSAAAIDINQTVAGGSVSITGNTFVDCGDNGSTSGAIKIKVRDISVEQSYGQAGDFAAEHNELVGSFEAVSVTNNTFTNCSRDIVVGTGYVADTYVDMTQSGNESYESDGTTTRDLIFVDNAHVDDAESLMNAFADEDLVLIEVFANITTTDIIVVDKPGKSVVLDLNGYTITANDTTTSTENGVSIGAGFLYLADGTLTVKDGTVNAIEDSFRVQTEATDDYAKLILADDLTVTSQNANAVYIRALNQQESTTPNAVLETAADLKVSGKYAAIQGNGTSTDGPVSVTVTGGDIVADPVDETIDGTGLYLPGRGEYLITGGTITAPTGVEFRAGTLTITGGTITATGEFAADPNGNGATTSGVAVAMMQHTTERDLTLNITGGEFNGAYAVYQQNIQNNDSGMLTMSLTGGTFNGNVDSENCTEYISGGQYSVKPAAEAFAPGFDGVEYDGYYVVIETTTDDIAALLAARIDAQADVRTYAAVLGIDWKAMEALADTDDVAAAALDAYNAIGNATSEGYVAIARSAAMDALDAYAAAMAESELEAAKLKAQTSVKMYIASADIGGWTNLLLINENGDRVEKDAVAPIFAMYDMIEKSTTVADIDAYMWKAISQVDTYVNALENWRKAAADEVTAAAQETAENADDAVVVPTSVYAAINGAVNYTEVNAYKTNALAEIADIRAYRADIAEQGSELDLIYGTLTEFKNAFDALDASLTGENNAFDTLLKDVQDAIATAQNAITGGTDESSESLASIKSYLENTIYKAMTDFKADVDKAFGDLGSDLAAYGEVLIALRDALVGDGTDGSVGKIDEILADIADAQSDITNIKTTVGSLATTEDLTTAVTDIKGALTVSEGKITSAITAAQNAITSAIASVRTDIDALETALAGYESDFEGLSGTLAQINSSLGGKIDAAQADIDAIKTAIDALGTPASAAAVTELATAIDELKAAVDEISVSVSAPSAVETVKTEATADIAEWLNAYVDEIVNSVTASNGKAYAAAVTFAPALETTDGDLYAKLLKAFDKDNADLVLKYYNDALTAIDAATTADEVNTAVATFKAQVASVEAASGNTSDLTVVYVLLIVVLVVLVVAVVVAAVLSRKRRVPVGYAPAPTPAPAPATSETTEQTEKAALAEKPEVTDDTAATAVEPEEAPDEDAGERVVINASVKTFDEAYDEMSDTLKDMFEKVREYALSKNGATGVRIGNGVRVKRGSKQIVKLTVRRGYPVAMFVLENEMLKDYRRTAGSSAKLKVPATELVLREPSDLDAAYMMVDLAVRQLDADVEAAKERRRELLRERRRQRREAMEAAKAAQAAQAEATTEQAEPAATEQNEAATPEQAVDEDKTE